MFIYFLNGYKYLITSVFENLFDIDIVLRQSYNVFGWDEGGYHPRYVCGEWLWNRQITNSGNEITVT